jgi:hypothetical protein
VSLVSVENFLLRHNWIELNGKSFIDPVCGVFVGAARGLAMESNQITDNGPRVETQKQPTAGPRGGIVVQLARTPLASFVSGQKLPATREGAPAARIAGNTVIAPHGRALWLVARGLVSVEGNEFTSRGVERDNQPGATVAILNTGVSSEAGGFFIGFSRLGRHQPNGGPPWEDALVASKLIGGKVLFNDNQSLLAPPPGRETINSSVLLLTADDALVNGNQLECRLDKQTLEANGLVFGWSARVSDNRFEERLASPGVSALTLAALNSTTDNQGTRCFIVIGIPALTVRSSNRSLMGLFNSAFCQRLSAQVAETLKGSGFDA